MKPLLSPKVKEVARTFIITFIKTATIITLGLLAFNWIASRYNIKEQLERVSGEVWLGTATAIAIPIFQWYKSKEQEEIRLAQDQARIGVTLIEANKKEMREAIAKIETRINASLLQMDSLHQEIKELAETTQAISQRNLDLDEKIDQYRYQVLKERLEIVKEVYKELCSIHVSLSYVKGHERGHEQAKDANLTEITAIADDIRNKKADFEEH